MKKYMKPHGLKPVVSYRQLLLLTNSIHALKCAVLSLAIIKSILLNFLFPKTCVICGDIGNYICDKCQKDIINIDLQRCLVCDQYSINGRTHRACKHYLVPDATISSFVYGKATRKIILKAKSGQNSFFLLRQLLIQNQVKTTLDVLFSKYKIDFIVPIPISHTHNERLKNHAEIICDFISENYNKPKLNILEKTTGIQQKELNRIDRFTKVHNKFYINKHFSTDITKKNILLVDDVATTGATLISATETLKPLINSGKIYCYTLCKDLRYNSINNVT